MKEALKMLVLTDAALLFNLCPVIAATRLAVY